MFKIYNLPEYTFNYNFIVARDVDGDLWFWGAWNTEAEARKIAVEIGGEVVSVDDIDPDTKYYEMP